MSCEIIFEMIYSIMHTTQVLEHCLSYFFRLISRVIFESMNDIDQIPIHSFANKVVIMIIAYSKLNYCQIIFVFNKKSSSFYWNVLDYLKSFMIYPTYRIILTLNNLENLLSYENYSP